MFAYLTGKNQDEKELKITLNPFQNEVGQDNLGQTLKRKFRLDIFTVFKYHAGCHK